MRAATGADLITLPDVRLNNDLVAATADALRERGLATGTVGLAGEDIMPLSFARELGNLLPQLQLESAEALLDQLRAIKSPTEQALLRRAAQIAGVGLRAVVDAITAGATEQMSARRARRRRWRRGRFRALLRVHSATGRAAARAGPRRPSASCERANPVVVDIIGGLSRLRLRRDRNHGRRRRGHALGR
jgi:Xaa-Pro aminopeptidase